jgi:hypothetical protein
MIDRLGMLLGSVITDVPSIVIIENQLQRANTLRVIQYAIHSYMRGRFGQSVKIVYQSGAVKFKLGTDEEMQQYAFDRNNAHNEHARYKVNKQYGLKIATQIMGESYFNDNTKNDDMADALCHVLYYINFKMNKQAARKKQKPASACTAPEGKL